MNRRLLLSCLAAALLMAAPAAADLGHQKEAVDSKIAALQDRLAAAHVREAALSAEISSVTTRIRDLEARVGDVRNSLAPWRGSSRCGADASRSWTRCSLFKSLTRQRRYAVERLNARLVDIYQADDPSTVDVILSAQSFDDLLDKFDYVDTIAAQDIRIAQAVAAAKRQAAQARVKTTKLRTASQSETQVITFRVQQVDALRASLAGTAGELAGAREEKRRVLAGTQQNEKDWVDEGNALRAVSDSLGAKIRAASAPPPTPSSEAATSTTSSSPAPTMAPGGFIWPVPGVITSPYGMRWGSLHPGIDIGAASGTPITAAAGGGVLVASYEGGYGNLVVLDNGGGIATAYAHQSSIAVAVGQQVSQGQVIGYVGSTGFSTGPHVHFEIRVGGSPVDPMGYL